MNVAKRSHELIFNLTLLLWPNMKNPKQRFVESLPLLYHMYISQQTNNLYVPLLYF